MTATDGAGLNPLVQVAILAALDERLNEVGDAVDRLPDGSAGVAALGLQVTALSGLVAELKAEVTGLTKLAQARTEIDPHFLAEWVFKMIEPELAALRADLAIVRFEVGALARKIRRYR